MIRPHRRVVVMTLATSIAGACLDFDAALQQCADGGRCSATVDGGGSDAATSDSGASDAATPPDASANDAAPPDDASSPPDASGAADAGHDAGMDASASIDAAMPPDAAGADAAVPPDAGLPDGSPADAGIVQLGSWDGPYSSTTSSTLVVPQTAGSLVIVAVAYQESGITLTTTDTRGNAFVALPATQANTQCGTASGSVSVAQIWYAANVPAGNNAITVTVNGPAAPLYFVVVAYSGIVTNNPVAASVNSIATTSSAVHTLANMTATAPRNLVFGFFSDENSGGNYSSLSGGFTDVPMPNANGFNAGATDDTSAGPGTYAPSMLASWGADSCWVATGAIFVGQ